MEAPLLSLCAALGHEFGDAGLLQQALTHRSAGSPHNERLEFLGDALLNFAVADMLFQARPRAPEGDLTRLRAALVCEDALARVARRVGIGEALNLGRSVLRTGAYRRDSILADALEAVLGAVLLDAGVESARAVCTRLFEPELQALPATLAKDAKTRLQEYLQGRGSPLPRYEPVSEQGPPHRREFRVACVLTEPMLRAEGDGSSRQAAEQQAAEQVLALLDAGAPSA